MPDLINISHADVESEYNLEGYNCFDANGEKLGDVDGVIVDAETMQPRYVVVDTGGWFSSKRFVVPAGDIRAIDDDARDVYFQTLTKELLQSGAYPRYDEEWFETDNYEAFSRHERDVARAYQLGRGEEQVDYTTALYQRPREGADRLQLLEERLIANKERYQAGTVRLGKRVTERTETVNVPVREERVIIERRPVAPDTPATTEITGEETVIEVPLMKEQAVLEKEAVVTEEVVVRKEAVEHTEHLEETVRKEELVVEGDTELIGEGDESSTPHHQAERAGRLPPA